jgi:RNA polymerase sigma factor (sigma-70 family)
VIDPSEHLGLLRLASVRVRGRITANAVADGWFGLVRASERYDPARGAFSTYALPCIIGAILDGRRARRGYRDVTYARRFVAEAGELPDDLASSDHADGAAEAALVRAAVLALPEQERAVLSLLYFEELPARDVARVMGVHESRVSQVKTQALGRLRKRLR